jgi:predicted AAA+ superfamily ATPase
LFPLTSNELTDFDLLKYCRYGGLPLIYLSDDPWRDLKEYVHLYMKEELNYQKVSNDAEVPPRTVANFIELLANCQRTSRTKKGKEN